MYLYSVGGVLQPGPASNSPAKGLVSERKRAQHVSVTRVGPIGAQMSAHGAEIVAIVEGRGVAVEVADCRGQRVAQRASARARPVSLEAVAGRAVETLSGCCRLCVSSNFR